jgi:sulfite exporter TauE/SafE
MTALLAGLALGVASSAHCAAMCGPLVLTIGRRFGGTSPVSQLRHALLYHGGRVLVYVVLAVPAGLGGEALALRGFGRALAVTAGVLLLAAAASAFRMPALDRITSRISTGVARAFAPVLRWAAARPVAGPLVTGGLNGLLPCGLVYAAMTAAAASGTVTAAAELMFGFGLGTSAVLLAITAGAVSLSSPLRTRLRPIGPIVLAITAIILLARGAGTPHAHAPAAAASTATHAHHH